MRKYRGYCAFVRFALGQVGEGPGPTFDVGGRGRWESWDLVGSRGHIGPLQPLHAIHSSATIRLTISYPGIAE